VHIRYSERSQGTMSGDPNNVPPIRPVSVRLPDDLAAQLAEASARRGVGVTELIREGIVFRLAFDALADATGEDVDAIIERALRHIGASRR
jgi:predicted transcriptional regulator